MPKIAATFLVLAFLVAAGAGFFPPTAGAGLEWKIIKDLDVKAAPLEVASSADGKRLFILTPGEVLVFSVPEDAVTGRIPIAQETGLDMQRYNADLKDPAIWALIVRDMQDGRQAEVRGTPTIFINGKLLTQRSLAGFTEAIEAELKKKR
jgi:hypothetical protein